jgi:hypothetical protein
MRNLNFFPIIIGWLPVAGKQLPQAKLIPGKQSVVSDALVANSSWLLIIAGSLVLITTLLAEWRATMKTFIMSEGTIRPAHLVFNIFYLLGLGLLSVGIYRAII